MTPLSHFRASEVGCELRDESMESELLCNVIRTVKDVKELFPGISCFAWDWGYSPHPSFCCHFVLIRKTWDLLGFIAASHQGSAEVPLLLLFIPIQTTGHSQSKVSQLG